MPGVAKVLDPASRPTGTPSSSRAGHAAGGGNPNAAARPGRRAARARSPAPGCPPGCRRTWPAASPSQVDQQKASGNTGNQVEGLSALFIIVLLVLIFRSLTLALTTLAPALHLRAHRGPAGRRGGPPRAAGVPDRPVPADRPGARGRHRLRAVPGVPGPGGTARPSTTAKRATASGLAAAWPAAWLRDVIQPEAAGQGRDRLVGHQGRRVDHVLRRHGDRRGAHAAAGHASRSTPTSAPRSRSPIAVMLIAGADPAARAAVDPAVAARDQAHAVQAPSSASRSCCRGTSRAAASRASGAGWPAGSCGTRRRRCVSGRRAVRRARRSRCFGYTAAGFGGNTSPPAGSDSAAGQALLTKYFPQSSANPTSLIFRFDTPVVAGPGAAGHRDRQAAGEWPVHAGRPGR